MITGSLVNHLLDQSADPKPEVGQGATILYWTDRRAGTVIEVSKSGRQIKVQEDIATRTDKNGMSDSQSYSYERNPNGSIHEFSLRNTGSWVRKGDSIRGCRVVLGTRRQYHDYSF